MTSGIELTGPGFARCHARAESGWAWVIFYRLRSELGALSSPIRCFSLTDDISTGSVFIPRRRGLPAPIL